MADGQDETGEGEQRQRGIRRAEIVSVILLAVTALAVAWSGYQASLWDGIQSSNYTQASGARTNAAREHNTAYQFRLADLTTLEGYVDAHIDGDTELAAFYEARFRDEFRPAFEAWIALDPFENPDAPPSPMAMPEYRLDADRRAALLGARADRLFAEGERANDISDTFTLTTLLFAIVLFLAAVSERFTILRYRWVLLGLSAVALVVGLVIALAQPVTTG